MQPIHLTYLNGPDVEQLALTDTEILDAVERALVEEQECAQILQNVAACRGAIDALMSEVFDGHIRMHLADPDRSPKSEKSQAARELIDAARAYLK